MEYAPLQHKHKEMGELADQLIGPVVFGGDRDLSQGLVGRAKRTEEALEDNAQRLTRIEAELKNGIKVKVRPTWITFAGTVIGAALGAIAAVVAAFVIAG